MQWKAVDGIACEVAECSMMGLDVFFLSLALAHSSASGSQLHALAFWFLIRCIIDACFAGEVQQLCAVPGTSPA